jgi:hypothetical protein
MKWSLEWVKSRVRPITYRVSRITQRICALRQRRTEHGTAFRILLSLLLFLLLFVCVLIPLSLPSADVLSAAEIHTEYISFKVIDSRKAAFYVNGLMISELGRSGSCTTGLLSPGLNTTVIYGRVGDGPVEVTIMPPPEATAAAVGLLDRADGKPLVRYTEAIAMRQDRACFKPDAGGPAMRLPIWGSVQVGREFQPAAGPGPAEPSMLIGGKLQVSAHAVFTRSLYDVRSITLPVASRLESSDRGAIWWGMAYVDPQKSALIAALATEAPVLSLYRPSQSKAEIISVTTLTQLTDDPNLILIYIVMLALGFLVTIAEWWAKHWYETGKTPF